uniref:Tudor domain-containing protein n=1 Tax=Esox lucius TaxID=8010 RepID=A0A6Q2YQ85_ESOLU
VIEIQNAYKTNEAVELGEFCLVEDVLTNRWFRGRVQNHQKDLFDVFLIDHGNVLSVTASHLAKALDELFMLPPKIICGFFANVLPLRENWDSSSEKYFTSLIGSEMKGYVHALLPHKVLILEAPGINKDLFRLSLGKHVDTDTFLLLVEILTELPLKQNIEPVPDLLIDKQDGQELSFKPFRFKGFEDILLSSGPKITPGQRLNVRITAAVNPGSFYCQMASMVKDLKEMLDKLALYCESKRKVPTQKCADNLGLLCSVKGKDEKWHRGFVQFLPVNSKVRVLFVDYGFCESVKVDNIPDKFAIEPAFAFSCSLVNVVPFDDVWTISSINCFRQAVSNKTLLVHIVNITKARYVVDLYEKDFNASQSALKSITELLTTTKHAEYWKYPTSTPKGEMENILMNQKSCEKGKVNEKGSNTSGVPRNLHKKTCDISKSDGFENAPEVPISRTPINQAAAMKFKEVKFKPGSEIAVRCSHINTPSDFWCQMQNKIPNLEEMMDAIQQYYQKHSLPMQSGSTCVVKSEEDGRWYRACIIGAEKDEVEVIFVDYGKVAKVNMYHLQAIVPEFLELEGQAFRCSLYNLIEPAKGSCSDWGSEASNLLKEFAQGQSVKLTCNVHAQLYMKHKGLCNVVNLYNSDQNAVKKLVERGLAREVKTPIQLMPSVWPHSFVYSSFNLRCGNVEQVYVTHVCSPWEIYCQLDRNSEIIQDLMEKVAMESEQIQRAKFGPSIGKLCLAKYDEDGQWYRGVAYPIQETLLVNVFFVDYGNMRIVEKHNVMSIPRHSSDLLFTPMQALRCSLSHIKKAENVAEVNKWMEKSILNKTLKAIVVGKNDDGAVFLYMYDGDLNINKKVKELIGSQKPKEKKSSSGPVNGHKGQIEQMTNQTRITKDRKSLKPTRKKVSFCNQYKHQKQSSNAQKANSPKCPNSQKDLEDQRQGKESTEGIKRDVQTVFHTKLPNLSQLPTDPKLKSGFRGLGFVSHINNINSFFIQMQDDEENIVKIAEDLNSDLLGDVVRNNTTLVDLRIYDLVAAEFEEDGAIYRAVVRDYASSDHFKVEFIDYGNTATVTKDKIYTLTDVFLMQCRLSMPCTLLNSDSYKSDAAFVDAVMGKPLMVEVVSRFGAQWEVEIEVQQDNPAFKVHYDKSKKVTEHEVQTSLKEPGLNNGPQRLFLAPVNMDLGYSGFAAAVTTPDEFYIAVEEMLLIMNTVSTILKDLPRELSPLHEEHFISMSCCLVWSDSKNKWCRAEIVHFDKTQVVINLVDYGHCVCLHYNDRFQLRRLPDSLARLPKIAYPCTLRGIKPVKGQWTDEAVVFFQQCLCQKNLKIYFRQYISEAHLEADVIADGVYVAKNLVDAGHAEYTDIMLGQFHKIFSLERFNQGLV